MSSENLTLLKEEAQMVDPEILMRYIRIFSELSNQIRYASQKRILVELLQPSRNGVDGDPLEIISLAPGQYGDRKLVHLRRGKNKDHILTQFVTDFTWYLRNLMLVQASDHLEDVIDMSTDNLNRLKEESQLADMDRIIHFLR